MKILKYLGLTILILIALFFIIPLFIGNQYEVSKTISIKASKEKVHEIMSDFSKFEEWSPWAELDSAMIIELSGNTGELGSTYSWKGNDDVGTGTMTISRIDGDTIGIQLVFKEPFEAESPTYYALTQNGDETEVTWYIKGEMSYPFNIFMLFMDMEEELGKDFDKGLGKLKNYIESQPQEESKPAYEITMIDFDEKTYLGRMDTLSFDDIEAFYGENLGAAYSAAGENGLEIIGAPSGIYFSWNEETGTTELAAAIPVSGKNTVLDGFQNWTLSGKAAKLVYFGNYDDLATAHYALHDYLGDNNLQSRHVVLEEYVTDPMSEPDTSKWVTNIYYFVEN